MKRRHALLAASVAQALRPFLLGFLAVDLGLADSGGIASVFLRYLATPQLAVPVCLFFLWYDSKKFTAFRPLALLLVGLSLAAALPALSAVIVHADRLYLSVHDIRAAIGRAIAVTALDLTVFLLLLFPSRESKPLPSPPPDTHTNEEPQCP
jgi:hypothetical protein